MEREIVLAEDAFRFDAIRQRDRDFHVAGDGIFDRAEFVFENPRQLFGIFDVVIIRVARLGEGGHEVLVVVVAETDGRYPESLAAKLLTELRESRGR